MTKRRKSPKPAGARGTAARQRKARATSQGAPAGDTRDEEDQDCYICDGTGHHESCESREPAWDIGDLICRSPCDGCCPNGCRPHGMQELQDETQKRAQALLGVKR